MAEQAPQIKAWGKKISGWNATTWRTSVGHLTMRSSIMGLFLLDQKPDRDALLDRMDRVSRLFPALRQRMIEPVGAFGQPRMVVDPNFDIMLHVKQYQLAAPGSWEQLMLHVRRESLTDFDRDRPLWRSTLIEGLEGGKAALLLLAHHAIADGQGSVMLIGGLADLSPEDASSDEPMPPAPEPGRADVASITAAAWGSSLKRAFRTAQKVTKDVPASLLAAAQDPNGAIKSGTDLVGSAMRAAPISATQPLSPLMVGRSGTYTYRTLDVGFPELRAAAKAHGGSINDAFLAAITGGVRIYHEKHDMPLGQLRVNVPVSTRTEADEAGTNAVMISRILLNAGETDVATRIRETSETVSKARQEPIMAFADAIGDLSRLLPVSVIAAGARASDVTGSNVPGFPMHVYMGGARVERMYPVVGNIGAAANITLLSYAGELCSLGISVDDAAVADVDEFVACLGEGFAEVGAPPGPAAANPLLAE